MPNKPFLSVVLPSYNEQANIKRNILSDVVDYLKSQDYSWELILSDDGSTDGTAQELDKFASKNSQVKVLHNVHAGKGPTVKAGMLAAQGEWRLYSDFDQSTPIKEIGKLLKYIPDNEVIFGSREIIGAKRDKEPFHRHLMGWGFNTLVRILAVSGALDTQCGFKLFSANATEVLFNKLYIYGSAQKRSDAFTGAFDVELLYIANKINFSMKEVPIHWKHHHSNRVSPIKDSLRMLRDILRIRKADWQNKYHV